jgi:oligopeptide/dipeptide ABC transporter ATP-binding protein
MSTKQTVLEVRDLRTYFFTRQGVGKAVDGVSFQLKRGATLGLVGESGSGKSLTALSILRLNPKPASRILGGQVLYDGVDLLKLTPKQMAGYRGSRVALILQDPTAALDPLFTIGDQIREPLRVHARLKGQPLKDRAIELLRLLRFSVPEQRIESYPHELSGGMRQRAVGAIALSGTPTILIADEATTSLDVTIEAEYVRLLREIQSKTSLAILFITHDFGVVARICDEVAVMYAGRIVEHASTRQIFDAPAHPYTEALMKSIPRITSSSDRLIAIKGSPPSIYQIPQGCPFADRCPYVMARCRDEFPPEIEVAAGQRTSCWRYARAN